MPHTEPSVTANTCYRAEITGCGVGGTLYSNVVCVTIDPAPTPNFSYPATCSSDPVVFTDLTNGNGIPFNQWAWDFGDGSPIDNNQNPTHTFNGPGPFNVTLTVTNQTGCVGTVVLPVNLDPAPTPNFSHVVACPGAATTFTDLSVVGGAGTINSWEWDFGDGSPVDNNTNPSHTYANSGIYNVQLIVGTTIGCSDTIVIPVTVPDIPVAQFNMNNVCDGVAGTFLDASVVGGGDVINQWDWDFGDGSPIDNNQNPSHLYNPSGAYNVTLTVTSSSGCTDDTTQQITIFPNPIADFSPTSVCAGNATQFNDLSNGNGGTINQWEWDFGDGSPVNNSGSPTHTYAIPQVYNATLIVSTVNGCADTVTLPVTVNAQPTADFTFVEECEGTAMNFTDASLPNGAAITQWEWDYGDASAPGAVANPSHTYANQNVYNVQLVVTSASGCTDTIVQPVNSYPIPVADFTPQSVCLNIPANFTDVSTVDNTNTNNNITQWAWDFDNGNTANTQGPHTQTYGTAGTYNISLTVTTDNGCSHQVVVPIDVFNKPVADFTFQDDCINMASNFTDQSAVGGGGVITQWDWDFGDNNTGNTTNPVHQYGAAGTYPVELIVTTASGCKDTANYNITMYPMPVASFSTADECVYDSVCFTNLSNVANPSTIFSHVWSLGQGPLVTTQDPCHLYSGPGTYNVQLITTSDHGCADDTTITITVHPKPTVDFSASTVCINEPPTVFTNGSAVTSGTIDQYNWNFDDGSVSNPG